MDGVIAPDTMPAHLEIDGTVASITLDRQDAFNTIDIPMAQRLSQLASQVEQDDNVRVLVIKGAGRGFCAGGDIGMFAAKLDKDLAPAIRELLTELHTFLCCLRRMPKLVLTSVHGAAAGAGFSLSFMGDLCIASENARFRPSYAQLGVSPDGGGTIGVVESVGPRRALQIFLAEEELTARQAFDLGLVNRLVGNDELEQSTMDFAHQLARSSREVIASTKSLVYASGRRTIEDQLNVELSNLLVCMETEEFRERVRSFMAKSGSLTI